MTRNTHPYKKKNNAAMITMIVLIALILLSILFYMIFADQNPSSKPSPSGSGNTAVTTPAPEKDPVWFENSAPIDNTIQYTPPSEVKYPYYIKVNRAMCTVTVYGIDANGEYSIPVKAFTCSVGKAGEETILGEYSMPEAYDWCYMVDGTYSQFSYRIHNGYMFHSVPCVKMTKDSLETEEYNKLGSPASLGCIRLNVANAKWIYDNCIPGTKTLIYDDTQNPGPLGKPETMKIPLDHKCATWDPTDPDPKNPWNSYTPQIEAPEITVKKGTAVDILQNVKALDTCGNDITDRIYWYGKYTTDVAGQYNITYGVVDTIGKKIEKTITITVADADGTVPEATASPAVPAAVNIDTKALESNNVLLMCLNNGTVLLDKNGTERAFPASITKIMTLLLSVENLKDMEEHLVIQQADFDYLASRDASMSQYPVGVEIRVIDLMYGSFMPSGADASVTLAKRIAGSEAAFADMMNQKAAEIGMKNTHYANCTGLHEPDQYTTGEDIAVLLKYAFQNKLFMQIFTATAYTSAALPGLPNGKTFKSTMFNLLPQRTLPNGLSIVGGKTGYTDDAGLCLASYAVSDKTANEYILVTMKAPGGYWDEPYPNHIKDALTVYSAIKEG